jgi:uncharacterized membrane protein
VTDRRLRLAALVLAVAGIAVAAYLTYVHYEGIAPVCGLGGDCERVQTSPWSELAGVPVAVLGLAGYLLVAVALVVDGERGRLAAVLLAWGGFAFSAYLTYRELFSIDAVCPWCVSSAILMTLLAALTTVRFLRDPLPSLEPHAH